MYYPGWDDYLSYSEKEIRERVKIILLNNITARHTTSNEVKYISFEKYSRVGHESH